MSSVPSTPFEKDVVEVLNAVTGVLLETHARLAHLEGHVAELSKRNMVIKLPKNRKLTTFVVGAAVGIYAYRTFVQSKVQIDLKDKDGASWSYQKSKGEEKLSSTTSPENSEDPDAVTDTSPEAH